MKTLRRFMSFVAIFVLLANQAIAATWYVDTNSETDPDTCVAGETDADADCTFRDAISQAASGDTITFLSSTYTFSPTSTYTIGTNNLVIDGNDFGSTVTFDGASSGGADAFTVTGDNVSLRDFYIKGAFDDGVLIDSTADSTLIDNVVIGFQSDGFTADGLTGDGVESAGTNWTIQNNSQIGNNGGNGITITGGSGFTITSSNIGTDGSGFSDYGNTGDGLNISGTITGTNTITGNKFVANGGDGIEFGASGAIGGTFNITGNSIGDVNGTTLGNGGHGIYSAENALNTTTINLGDNGFSNLNAISSNSGDGVHLESCSALYAEHNVIGSDNTSGTGAYGNTGDGMEVDCATIRIGTNLDASNDDGEWNHIVDNGGYGIYVNGDDATSVTIHGNFIGSDQFGGQNFENFGNALGGIEINATSLSSLIIGTNDSNAENRILENGGGIRVSDTGTDATISIKNNAIGVEDETFPFEDPVIVGNNGVSGYQKGVVVDLATGTADVDIGATSVDSDQGNDIIGHTSHGIEIGNGVKTLDVKGNNIGVAYDYDTTTYVRDGGNGGAGVYVNSTDAILTSIQIGESGSATYVNRIGGNNVNGINVVDAGSTPASVNVDNNLLGIGQDDSTDLGNTGVGILIGDGNVVTVDDNQINNSSSHGVQFTGGTSVTMTGNVIGNNTGDTAAGNGGHGVHVNASTITSFVFGANSSGDGNVISASTNDGLYVQDTDASATVTLVRNIIGVCAQASTETPSGSTLAACTNGGSGVQIDDGATVTIGGDNSFGATGAGALGEGNMIVNNTEEGIRIGGSAVAVTIRGNAVGVGRTGSTLDVDLGNGRDASSDGIEINGTAITSLIIGGVGSSTESSLSNVIGGNDGDGIDIINLADAAVVTIKNNIIGMDWTGVSQIANGGTGIKLADGTATIGGVEANAENVIAGNGGYGIYVSAGAASIFGNLLGVKADGTTALSNTLNSLRAVSTAASISSLTIGGSETGQSNTVNNSSVAGIYLADIEPSNGFSSTFNSDNSWTDSSEAPGGNYWEYYVASALTYYGPGGESGGGAGNSSDSSSVSESTTTTNSGEEGTGVELETTPVVEEEEVVVPEEVVVDEEDLETPYEEQIVSEEFSLEFSEEDEDVAADADAEGDAVDAEEVVNQPFRDQALPADDDKEPVLNDVAQTIADFEESLDDEQPVDEKVGQFLDDVFTGNVDAADQEKIDNTLKNVFTKKIEKELVEKANEDFVLRNVGGGNSKVDKNTKLVFEPDFEKAKRLQLTADNFGENTFVVTSFTDIDDNGVADMLEVVLGLEEKDEEAGAGNARDLAEKIFFGEINLYGSKLNKDEVMGIAPHGLEITNVPSYGATVGKEMMFWVVGEDEGDNYELVIINRDTQEEILIAKGELDEGRKAAVPVIFPEEGDYYVVVQSVFGGQHVVRVMVDFEVDQKVEDIDLLGEYQPKVPVSAFNISGQLHTDVLLAIGFQAEDREVKAEDDRVLTGYADPGSMVFVTWQSVVMNSVVIADAGQGYFEVKVPEDLEDGDHKVTVYNYSRKNQKFSGVLSQLFRK